MHDVKNSPLFKAISLALAFTFISLDISYAYPPERHSGSDTLSAPSLLQPQPVSPGAARAAREMRFEGAIVASVCDLGDYFFGTSAGAAAKALPARYAESAVTAGLRRALGISGVEVLNVVPVEYLRKTVPEKLDAALKEIGFTGKLPEEGVIFVLYKKGGKRFLVQIAEKDKVAPANLPGYEWSVSDKYLVKYVTEAAPKPASSDLEAPQAAKAGLATADVIAVYTYHMNSRDAGSVRLAVDDVVAAARRDGRSVILLSEMTGPDYEWLRGWCVKNYQIKPEDFEGLVLGSRPFLRSLKEKAFPLLKEEVLKGISMFQGGILPPAYADGKGFDYDMGLYMVSLAKRGVRLAFEDFDADIWINKIMRSAMDVVAGQKLVSGYSDEALKFKREYYRQFFINVLARDVRMAETVKRLRDENPGSAIVIMGELAHRESMRKYLGRAGVTIEDHPSVSENHPLREEEIFASSSPLRFLQKAGEGADIVFGGKDDLNIMRSFFEEELRNVMFAINPEADSEFVYHAASRIMGRCAKEDIEDLIGLVQLFGDTDAIRPCLIYWLDRSKRLEPEEAGGLARAIEETAGWAGSNSARLAGYVSKHISAAKPSAFGDLSKRLYRYAADESTKRSVVEVMYRGPAANLKRAEELLGRLEGRIPLQQDGLESLRGVLKKIAEKDGERAVRAINEESGARFDNYQQFLGALVFWLEGLDTATTRIASGSTGKLAGVIATLSLIPAALFAADRAAGGSGAWAILAALKDFASAHYILTTIAATLLCVFAVRTVWRALFPVSWNLFVMDTSDNEAARKRSAGALLRAGVPVIPRLINAFRRHGRSSEMIEDILAGIGEPAIAPLVEALGNKDVSIRSSSRQALVKIGSPAIEPLIMVLRDKDPEASFHACLALDEIGVPAIEPVIGLAGEALSRAGGAADPDLFGYAATILAGISNRLEQKAADIEREMEGMDRGKLLRIVFRKEFDGAMAAANPLVAGEYAAEYAAEAADAETEERVSKGFDYDRELALYRARATTESASLRETLSRIYSLAREPVAAEMLEKGLRGDAGTFRWPAASLLGRTDPGIVIRYIIDSAAKRTPEDISRRDMLTFVKQSIPASMERLARAAQRADYAMRVSGKGKAAAPEVIAKAKADNSLSDDETRILWLALTGSPEAPAKPEAANLEAGETHLNLDPRDVDRVLRWLANDASIANQYNMGVMTELAGEYPGPYSDKRTRCLRCISAFINRNHSLATQPNLDSIKWLIENKDMDSTQAIETLQDFVRIDKTLATARNLKPVTDILTDEKILTIDIDPRVLISSLKAVDCFISVNGELATPEIFDSIKRLLQYSVGDVVAKAITSLGVCVRANKAFATMSNLGLVLKTAMERSCVREGAIAASSFVEQDPELKGYVPEALMRKTASPARKPEAAPKPASSDLAAPETAQAFAGPIFYQIRDFVSGHHALAGIVAAFAAAWAGAGIWRWRFPVSWHIWILKTTNSARASARAADALVRIGEPAIPSLIKAFDSFADSNTVRDILAGIGRPAVEPLIEALRCGDTRLRSSATDTLSKIGTDSIGPLIGTLRDPDPDARFYAYLSLVRIGAPAVEPLIASAEGALGDIGAGSNETLVRSAVMALADISAGMKKEAGRIGTEMREMNPDKLLRIVFREQFEKAQAEVGSYYARFPTVASNDEPGYASMAADLEVAARVSKGFNYDKELAAYRSGAEAAIQSLQDKLSRIHIFAEDPRAARVLMRALLDNDQGLRRTAQYLLEKASLPPAVGDAGAVRPVAASEASPKPASSDLEAPARAQAPQAAPSAATLFDIIEGACVGNRSAIVHAANRAIASLAENGAIADDSGIAAIELSAPTAEIRQGVERIVEAAGRIDGDAMPARARKAVADMKAGLAHLEADSIVASAIAMARRAKHENQKLIIGLDTGWIPGYGSKGNLQNGAMASIVHEIESLGDTLRSLGLDNVTVIHEDGEALAASLLAEADKTHTKLANVIVLGSSRTLASAAFGALRSTTDEQRAFLAAVDPTLIMNAAVYAGPSDVLNINLIEMLSIALELAAGKEPPRIPMIVSYDSRMRMVIFLPRAAPIDYETLKKAYEADKRALASA